EERPIANLLINLERRVRLLANGPCVGQHSTGRDPPRVPHTHSRERKTMKWCFLPVVLVLVASVVGLHAAEPETFTGTASATGTYKRPLLLVGDKQYELKPSDQAEVSVAKTLEKFSKGDTGTYAVKGTRDTVNGNDGIIVDSIAPAKAAPGTTPSAA